MAFFFMVFVIAGSFFATSLFVGEIVHTYSKVSDEEGLMLTEDEKQWAVAMKAKIEIVREQEAKKKLKKGQEPEPIVDFYPPGFNVYTGKPQKKGSCGCITNIRVYFFDLVMHPIFDNIMMTIIM